MFINRQLVGGLIGLCLLLAVGCKSKFEQIRTSNNIAQKYQEAIKYYEKGKYSRALVLFDDLIKRYRGQAEAEDLYYYVAYTNYRLKDYTSARYHFQEFADYYANSPRTEECRFMAAYCFYLEAPRPSLDQEYTHRAIESLQLFINLFPESERAAEAADLIQELRDRLEQKAFANAKLYLDMGLMDDYRAAVIAFDSALRDFPDTKYAEEMEFLSLKAQYLYAKNSTLRRQEERFNQMLDMYSNFIAAYPESKFKKEADELKKQAEQGLKEAKKNMDLYQAAVAEQEQRVKKAEERAKAKAEAADEN